MLLVLHWFGERIMKKQKIKKEIRNFLVNQLKLKNIENNTKLFEESILDSLHLVEIIVFIEKKYEISIELKDIQSNSFEDINNISEFVFNKIKE